MVSMRRYFGYLRRYLGGAGNEAVQRSSRCPKKDQVEPPEGHTAKRKAFAGLAISEVSKSVL